MKYLLTLTLFLLSPTLYAANVVYIAQSGSNVNGGTSCVDAKALTYFNTAGNWSATPTGIQIGPDTTVHLCGTTTLVAGGNALTFQLAGTSGHPVILFFDSSSVSITAPYFDTTNGAINLNGMSNTTVDCNGGSMLNTLNGSGLANTQASKGLVSNTTIASLAVKNCLIYNLYTHTSNTDSGGANVYAVFVVSGSHLRLTNNTIHDVRDAFDIGFASNVSDDIVSGNTIYNINTCLIYVPTAASSISTAPQFVNNDCHDFVNWDDTTVNNAHHHNAVHMFDDSFPNSSYTSGAILCNNYLHGDMGIRSSSFLFDEQLAPSNTVVCNNVFAPTAYSGNALVYFKQSTGGLIANNYSTQPGGQFIEIQTGATGVTVKNNATNCTASCTPVYVNDSGSETGFTANNNDWYASTGIISFCWVTCGYTPVQWPGQCSCDGASVASNPNVDVNYKPLAGSPLITLGLNLTSLGITTLNSDKAGSARPAGGSWVAGAYNFLSNVNGNTAMQNGMQWLNGTVWK